MNIRNFKISTRLMLGFTIILFCVVVLGFFSLKTISDAAKVSENMFNHPFKVSNSVREIETNIVSIHRSMKDVALAETPLEMITARNKVDQYEKEVFQKFEIIEKQFLGDQKDVSKALKSFTDWKIIREEVILLWSEQKKAEAIAITKGKGANHVNKVLSDVNTMIDFANQKANEYYSDNMKKEQKAYNIMLGLIAATILLCIFIVILLSRSIILPIKTINENAKEIEDGNLNIVNPTKYNDEITMLAKSFNSMVNSIKNRNKILTDLTRISTSFHGVKSIPDFTKSLLSIMIEFSESEIATFYIFNENDNIYQPIDAVGAPLESLVSFKPENIPGDFKHAITSKNLYLLKNVNKKSFINYKSLFGKLNLKEVITIPIFENKKVVALISCGKLTAFSIENLNTFSQSVQIITAGYNTLLANNKTKEYSNRLSKSNQELEMQSEELREQANELQLQSRELKVTSENLKKQNVELEVQRKQVEEANRLKSEFLSNMSHELRTPLNSINALSKVLIMQSSQKLDEEESNYLTIIERNGKRLLSLINDILDLSKVESGKMELEATLFSLNNSLLQTIENLQSLAEEKNLEIHFHATEEIEIESDAGKLFQVFTNIIGNAIKFTDKGEINVYCNKIEDQIRIEIQDTGIGIEKEILPFIFQEFRQADGTTSRKYEGTGLGLAIAQKIVKALHGHIKCESQIGVGSRFYIEFPIKWNNQLTTNIQNKELISKKHGDKTILVIDDDEHFINDLSAKIESEGYHILKATSGKQALKLANEYRPHAITLDLVMPEMDGWEVLQQLKQNETTANIPVIIISNSDEKDTGIALGAVGYIQKPAEKEVLIKEIQKVNSLATNILVVDDNEVDILHIFETLKNEKYQIYSCSGGQECLNYLENEIPHVLILDLMMPDIDGFTVIKKIRENKRLYHLPIIVVTAKDLSLKEKLFLKEKASAILAKGEATGNQLSDEVKKILLELKKYQFEKNKSKRKSILIVEDNESAIVQVQKVLENEELIVHHVKSGEEALDFVNKQIPDGIILDLMMPGMDGFEVLENIRNNSLTENIPVIILTAKTLTKTDLNKLTSKNIQQLIQKGDIDTKELIQKVDIMLGKNINPDVNLFLKNTVKNKIVDDKQIGEIKILLIEDNPDNRITIKAILGNKYRILEAEDGESGLILLKKELPHLLLLDISLPGMDGFEVIKQIREDEIIHHIPVIAVTAKAMKNDKEDIITAGCDDYISKPIDHDELHSKIEKYLS